VCVISTSTFFFVWFLRRAVGTRTSSILKQHFLITEIMLPTMAVTFPIQTRHDTRMRNAFWFIAGGLVLLLAFIVRSPYLSYAAYAFLLLVAISHFSSWAWLSGLDCERAIDRITVRQGEDITVTVKVTNQRGWPIPWIFFEDLHPKDFPRDGENSRLCVLMPGRSVEFSYTLTCPRRGYHRIGPLLMESGDLFGLQRRFITGKRQDYISVLPTVAYIDTFTISAKRPQGPVRISNRIYEDPTRISGVREYHPGDPLNRIHWKASARTGDLFTKQTEPSNVLGATLILDLHKDAYTGENAEERSELAITTAASIAYLLQMSGEQLGMITNARDAAEIARYEVDETQALSRGDAESSVAGEDKSDKLNPLAVETRRSPVQALKIIENLARVIPSDGLAIDALIMSEFRRIPRDATLIPIVSRVTPELALVLAEMKISGFPVTAFVIKNQHAYEEASMLLARESIDVIHIEAERDLHELSPTRI